MTGIDKIKFALPYYDPEDPSQRPGAFNGLRLRRLLEGVGRNLTPCVRRVKNESGYFAGFEEMPGVLIKHGNPRHAFNPLVHSIEANPSHFSRWLGFEDFIDDLNQSQRWIDHAQIKRLDLAADYNADMNMFCSGLDFPNRRVLNLHVEARSGRRESMRLGSQPEVLLVYQRPEERYFNGIPRPIANGRQLIRVERQLRIPSKIQSVLGVELTYANLQETLMQLAMNDFSFFGTGIELGSVQLIDAEGRHVRFRERQLEFRTLAWHNSYFEARKYLNANDNFRRDYGPVFTRTALPLDMQPNAVLARTLRAYLTPSRRRQHPVEIPSL